MTLGYKEISDIIKNNQNTDALLINILLKPSLSPNILTYNIINSYPHDTSSFTQGLEYHNDMFLESTGIEGWIYANI